MIDMLEYGFMQNAFIAAFLVSVACGIVGTYVVIKRITFISGGISHAAFGGIGLGYLLGLNPLLCAIPFSLASALGIGVLSRQTDISEDTAIGVLWSLGMALGILFISFTPGYAPDLFGYLFGSILTVPRSDLAMMAALDIIIIMIATAFHREFLMICFDEDYATVSGVATQALYLTLLGMVGLSVVLMIRVVGVILIIALLTIPSSISKKFTYNTRKLILLSMLTGSVLTTMGISLSYVFDLPTGATIVVVLTLAFFAVSILDEFNFITSISNKTAKK